MDYIEEEITGPEDQNSAEINPAKADLRIIDTDLDAPLSPPKVKQQKTIRKKKLVDKLNSLNFSRQSIQLYFKNRKDGRIIAFKAHPQLCFGKNLVCLWEEPLNVSQVQHRYVYQHLLINEEQAVITVNGSLRALSKKGLCLRLPEKSLQSSSRKARRFFCEALSVCLIQNGVLFSGHLVDFSAQAFRVAIHASEMEPHQWLNLQDRINILILKGNDTIYSGECRIFKKEQSPGKKHLILEPLTENIQRFCPKQYRSKRQELSPAPDIVFYHPFTDKLVTLKVLNISGFGLSVEDDEDNSVLIPGMIIPELAINMANTSRFRCKAQVIYRNRDGNKVDEPNIQCGIAILDMDCEDHMRLLSLLHQAENKHLYICSEVDQDQLWRFFFESGFLYPRKYQFIKNQRDTIKKSYASLYTTNSNISRYFIWQQKGVIQGHLSMLRFYENTWLIHHLAALPSSKRRIGVEILKQIGSFTYDSHRLFSSHMDYLICYFRPENRFSNHFFAGICRHIQNPNACSIDSFAYLHYRPHKRWIKSFPEGWRFIKSTAADLEELRSFYEQHSGGSMLEALDLMPDEEMPVRHTLANEYRKQNMKRERRLYSLKHNEILKAVFMANISDFAINLSDLTNSVSVFVIDPEDLAPEILYAPIHQLADRYEQKTFPILIFPLACIEALSYERTYNLWVLNMEYTDDYFTHFHQLI